MFKQLSQLFQGKAATAEQPAPESSESATLKTATATTGQSLVSKLMGIFGGPPKEVSDTDSSDQPLTDDHIDEIEEVLLKADVGLNTSVAICDRLRQNKRQIKNATQMMQFIQSEFSSILSPFEKANQLTYQSGRLNIYLVVGVNGAGKTTFIGKLAHRFIKDNKKVVIGAGDTFRAAAVDQLAVWAERAGATFIQGADQADPASVIFEALKTATEQNADVLLLDTAGRLQNKYNLMAELEKIRRVIDKTVAEHNASLESLLVLDATTGQNALRQAEVFKQVVNIDGVILTKLDGSAKGGIVLSIAQEYQLPVKMVGVGEKIEDLQPFEPQVFLEALFERK